jgi:DNA-binding MarR family transcriptional regulator
MKAKMAAPGPCYAATLQLLRTAEALWNGSRLFFARWELSPSQFNVLNLLADQSQGLSQIELSRQLIMHRSNVTGLVDRLEARGLVARRETPGDRRAYQVGLTGEGRRLLQSILPYYYQAAEEVWGDISAKEAGKLVATLTAVSQRVEQNATGQY